MFDLIGKENSNEKVVTSEIKHSKNFKRLFLSVLVIFVAFSILGVGAYWKVKVGDSPVIYRGEVVDIQITQKTVGIVPEEEMKKITLNTVSVMVGGKRIEFGINPEMRVKKVSYNLEKLDDLSWEELKIGDSIVLVVKKEFKDVEVISPEFIDYIGVIQ